MSLSSGAMAIGGEGIVERGLDGDEFCKDPYI
jgi:hypothetical protein